MRQFLQAGKNKTSSGTDDGINDDPGTVTYGIWYGYGVSDG